ncbi:uncharacterized protein LOC120325703 isoform X1 [Styela clava]
MATCKTQAAPILDESDDDSFEELDVDNTDDQVTCIFTGEPFSSPLAYYTALKNNHGFDIWQIALCDLSLDFFGYVKVINFLRKKYFKKSPPSSEELSAQKSEWVIDDYLKPVIENDPLLRFMLDDGSDFDSEDETDFTSNLNATISNNPDGDNKMSEIQILHEKLKKSEKERENLSIKLTAASNQISQMKSFMQDIILTGDVGIYRPVAACRQDTSVYEEEEYEDAGYFGTYSHHDIHAEMLQDTVRTNSYKDVIFNNKERFVDKIVLDVGCGTGILSMFAAKAGAKHVYGIDMSEIAFQAMDIVKENNLDDRITILKGRVEEVDLPVSNVDIIISEWMGYFLLYESMLDSVLYARDKWLVPTGELFPNHCSISLIAIHDDKLVSSNVTFWKDVYGFKMSCLRKQVLSEATIQALNPSSVMSEPCVVHRINVGNVQSKNLNYKSDFSLKIIKSGSFSAIAGYFDIFQNHSDKSDLMFSTSPCCTPTHWKQAVFFLDESMNVSEGDIIHGKIDCHKNVKDPRSLVISLTVNDKTQLYKIE